MLIFLTFLQNVQHNFKTLGQVLYQECDICFKSVKHFVFITWLVMSLPKKLLQWEVKDDCSLCLFWWYCWPSLFELFFSFFIMVYPRSKKTTNFPPSTGYREMKKKKKTIRTKVTLTNSLKRKAITTINIPRQIIKSSGYKFYHFSCIGAIVQGMESTIWMTLLSVIKDLLRQVKQRNRFWIDE